MELGDREMVGAGAAKFNVTAVFCGVFVAPGAEMVIVAGKVPAKSPAIITLTVTLVDAPADRLPLVGERVSQGALSVTLQLRVLPPLLVICKI